MNKANGRMFTQSLLLASVERGLFHQFLGRFETELGEKGLSLPDPALPHDEYCRTLSRLLMPQAGLPHALWEALTDIEEMAHPEGRERLQEAIAIGDEKGLARFREDSSDLDFAIQAWLLYPQVFKQKKAELQKVRLYAFEYFRATRPAKSPGCQIPPNKATMDRLVNCIDTWHARHLKGVGTTHIDTQKIDGELWFIIRHGDGCMRVPTIGQPQRHVAHFRPERDDVVVYSPEFNELRINVRTKGEARLYRDAIGLYLFGDATFFADENVYTLEPLREQREGVLDVSGITGVTRIVLKEFHAHTGDTEATTRKLSATDLFAYSGIMGLTEELFPTGYRICLAVFDFHFTGEQKPCSVHVCPPNKLKLPRRCNLHTVLCWLSLCDMKSVTGLVDKKGALA